MWCSRLLCRRISLPLVSILSWRTRKWPSISGMPDALARRAGLGPCGVGLGRGAAPQGAVRPDVVVVVAEPVELLLEIREGGGSRLGGQPFLLGLVEALHLAAGLWVVGPGVAEHHAAGVQGDLEGDSAVAAGSGR